MQRRVSGPRLWTVTRIKMSVGDGLGIFDEHIEIAVVVENAGIEQLEFRLLRACGGRLSSTSRA